MSDYESDLLEDKIKTRTFDPVLLSRLISFVRPYWLLAVAGFSLTLVSVLMMLVTPLLVGNIVDVLFKRLNDSSTINLLRFTGLGFAVDHVIQVATTDVFRALWYMAMAFFTARLLQFLIDWGNGYLLANLSQRVLYDIRMKIYTHIQTRSLAYFHRNPVGRLITRVTNDVGALDDFFSQALVSVLKDIVLIAAIIVLMLLAHWQLALVTMCVLPPMILISAIFRHFSRRAYRRWRAALSHLNAVMAETVNGVRVIQLFRREKRNAAKYAEVGEEYKRHFLSQRRAWAWYRPGYTILQAATMALVLWFGGGWLLQSMAGQSFDELGITPGMLALFIMLAEMFFQPIRDLVEKFDVIQSASTSGERIFTVLDEKDQIAVKADGIAPERLRGDISFDAVEFSYIPGEPVLRGVSFKVEPGQLVAIVGATGAGKTTIINLISRFYDIQGGRILVDGVDVRDYNLRKLRENIAVVHQDVFLFAGTIEENLSLMNPRVSPEAVRAAAQAVGVEPIIQRYKDGYNHHVEEQGRTFSAGERQLLSFARALAHDPAVLVLDEATSSIDTRSEMVIQKAMKTLMQGRTSIVIAHRLSTIQHADLILVMHKGELAESGNHQQLLRKGGLYKRLYDLQFARTEAVNRGSSRRSRVVASPE